MTSQSPRIYTYKITFEEVPYYYYGVHKEKVFDEYYMGTPYTHKWVWYFYTPKKQILELFEYSDNGYNEAQEVEKRLIRPVYNTDNWCLNENCGGFISLDICRKSGNKMGPIAGKKSYELGIGVHGLDKEQRIENARNAGLVGGKIALDMGVGIHALTTEQRSENGKIGGAISGKISGPKTYELGIGIHGLSTEELSEAGNKGGTKTKEEKLGIFSMTPEEWSEAGRKGGKIGGAKTKENGAGIFAMTPEEKSKLGKQNGKKAFEEGLGCFSLTPKERAEVSRKVGLKTKEEKKGIFAMTPEQKAERSRKVGLQKWRCLITGHIANAGNLSKYQRAREIDTSMRERLP
jgi:general stress protein YciG